MKAVTVDLTQPPEHRHPMHEFVVAHEGFEESRLLEMNLLEDGHWTALFEVVGDAIAPYETALGETEDVLEYEISSTDGGVFYVYTLNAPTEQNQRLVEAARQRGLVVPGPIAFRADGSIRMTLVGPADVVQAAIDAVPEAIEVTARSVGEYHAGLFGAGSGLTDRQREAVTAAVAVGYYEEPRAGSVADVADRLECAPGTAAELLRRAEAAVMAEVAADEAA